MTFLCVLSVLCSEKPPMSRCMSDAWETFRWSQYVWHGSPPKLPVQFREPSNDGGKPCEPPSARFVEESQLALPHGLERGQDGVDGGTVPFQTVAHGNGTLLNLSVDTIPVR